MAQQAVNKVSPPRVPVAGKGDLDAVKEQLRPFLKQYLRDQGIEVPEKGNFKCFAHADKEPSMSIKNDHFTCFACGAKGDIFEACHQLEKKTLTGKGFVETVRYLADRYHVLFPETSATGKTGCKATQDKQLDKEYVYVDAEGKPLYKVQRFIRMQFGQPAKDTDGKVKKDFSQMRFHDGGWAIGLGDVKRVLYQLPEVTEAIAKGDTIFFAEGEKCADIIREKLGLVATAIAGGAKAWIKPHVGGYVPSLVGANVVILPDNDGPGRKFADDVANSIAPVVSSVKILELPGLPTKGDIEQWIQMNHEKPVEDLLALVKDTKEWSAGKKAPEYDSSVYVSGGTYWRRGSGKQEDVQISNFVLSPLYQLVSENGNPLESQWIARIEANNGLAITTEITLEVFVNRMKFRTAMSHEGVSFIGTDNDLQGIKVLFGRCAYDKKQGVGYIGLHTDDEGRSVFVSQDGAIYADGSSASDIAVLGKAVEIKTSILEQSTIVAQDAVPLLQALFGMNTLDKCAILIGWASACYLREKFKANRVKFPLLFIYGEAGSGKTQTVESALMPFFGLEKKYSAGDITRFALAKAVASSNVIPLIGDEYKPAQMGDTKVKLWSEFGRNTYDEQATIRGRQDQTTNEYVYRAPMCIIGEEGPEETAIKERALELLFSKRDLGLPGAKEAFQYVKQHSQHVLSLGRTVLGASMETPREMCESLYEMMMEDIRKMAAANMPGLPDRVASSAACCMVGLVAIDEAMRGIGVNFYQTIGKELPELMEAVLQAVYENNMEGQSAPRSAIDSILEVVARMAGNEFFRRGVHYRVDGNLLILHVGGIYDDFKEHRKKAELHVESLEQRQFTKQLRKASYFVRDTSERMHGINDDPANPPKVMRKVVVLDLEKLGEIVDVSGFTARNYAPI